MQPEDHQIQTLLERWYNNTITSVERQQLIGLLDEQSLPEQALPFLEQVWENQREQRVFSIGETNIITDNILKKFPAEKETAVRPIYWRSAVAAAIILLAGTGAWMWMNKMPPPPAIISSTPIVAPPAAAPSNKVTLLLDDGSSVMLDSNGNHVIGQGITQSGKELQYDPQKSRMIISYNTLTTPRGQQFQVKLPDGTRVWLNAASSIKYPTRFMGNDRLVQITGEAYFEVVPDVNKPFRVKAGNGSEIMVLGTSFNVSAYREEPVISTTLLNGSVMVKAENSNVILKPGQQANINQASITVNNNADIDKVMAWKNGLFNFEDAGIVDVMRQLTRWYDMEVVYEKGIPDIYFTGKMSRDLQLEDILEGLKGARVHFRLEGKKLIVLP